MVTPLLDDDSSLLQTVEDLPVEALIAQFAVEGFAVAILATATALRSFNRPHTCNALHPHPALTNSFPLRVD